MTRRKPRPWCCERGFKSPTPYQRVRDRQRAQLAIGRPLKPSQPIHHHTLEQIVICEDVAYHYLLHQRTKALACGGDPNTDKMCPMCGLPEPFKSFARQGIFGRGECFGTYCRYCSAIERTKVEQWGRARLRKPLIWDWEAYAERRARQAQG